MNWLGGGEADCRIPFIIITFKALKEKLKNSSGRANYAYIFHVFRPYRKSDNCELLSPVLSPPHLRFSFTHPHLTHTFPTSSILTIPSNEPVNTAKRRKAGKKKGDARISHRTVTYHVLSSFSLFFHFTTSSFERTIVILEAVDKLFSCGTLPYCSCC